MMHQQPKKSIPWLIFCAIAVALIFLAIGVRVQVEHDDTVTNYADQTPVSASYSNTNIRQGAGSSTHAQFSKSTKTIKGVNGNPWNMDYDNTGDLIYDEIPSDFCKYFKCASDFWTDNRSGYIVECQDGEYTRTGGYANACSGHGGVKQTLYRH